MPRSATEELLNEIGQLLAEDREYPLAGTLLFARVDLNMVNPSIFKDRGNEIVYCHPDLHGLGDALLDLWDEQTGKDRWREIHYLVRDGRFEVTYVYPEDLDDEEDWDNRRDKVVSSYFGEKPVRYPPLPDFDFPTYEL